MNATTQCHDLKSLSYFLGFASQHLYYLVESPQSQYIRIKIPKKSGSNQWRTIDIPNTELKGVQRAINNKILAKLPNSETVYSYVKGRSVLDAAQKMCAAKAVMKVDISNFFPSITTSRVYGFFVSLGFNQETAFLLSRLTTNGSNLVQGAPTSPLISNLIVKQMDRRLIGLANKWELEYLRYSDDLFFFKQKNFNHPKLYDFVDLIVTNSGFVLNTSKKRYYPRGVPRTTLGLLTHGDRPQIPGSQRRRYRTMFFKASRNQHWAQENEAQLKGILEWYKLVYGKNDTYFQYLETLNNIKELKTHDTYRTQ